MSKSEAERTADMPKEAGRVLHECTESCDHPSWWYAQRKDAEIAALREEVESLRRRGEMPLDFQLQ